MSVLIEEWQQGNIFSITLRGHKLEVPVEDGSIQHTLYDSFYSPVDFSMGMITAKLPDCVPPGTNYDFEIRINGGIVDEFSIPQNYDFNVKTYRPECTFAVLEDDFVEVSITFEDEEDLLEFNNHNCHFAISGCISYKRYKDLFLSNTDTIVAVYTENELSISSSLIGTVIDGYELQNNDLIILNGQSTLEENGVYKVTAGASEIQMISESDRFLAINHPIESRFGGFYKVVENEIDELNYYSFSKFLMEWEQGCFWWKTNILLQNRSGLDRCGHNTLLDIIMSPMDFIIQGVSIVFWDDKLVKTFSNKEFCTFLDIMVNEESIFPFIDEDNPIKIDISNPTFTKADISFNTDDGLPVSNKNLLSIITQFNNRYEKLNGKRVQCYLSGCTPDCYFAADQFVAVYDVCDDDQCQFSLKTPRRVEPTFNCSKKKYEIAKK